MERDRSSVARAAAVLTVSSLTSQVLSFFWRICLTRLAGAEVMGLYQLLMPAYSVLLALTATGLTAAVSNLAPRYAARGELPGVRLLLRRCRRAFFLAFLPLAAVMLLASDPISVWLLGDARTRLGLILLLPCLLLTGFENLHKHVFYGIGRAGIPAASEIIEQAIRTAAILLLLRRFPGLSPERTLGLVVVGMCCSELFSSFTLTFLAHRALPRKAQGDRADVDRQVRTYAVPAAVTVLLGNLLGCATSVLIPRLLIRGGMDPGEAMRQFGTVCGMTVPMLSMPACFVGAMELALRPRLSGSAALGRTGEIRRLVARALTTVSALLFPSAALLGVLGPDLGFLIFRTEGAGKYALPLALAVIFGAWRAILSGALTAAGRTHEAARCSIVCGAFQLLLTAALLSVPGLFLRGYVAAELLGALLSLLLTVRLFRREIGLELSLFRFLVAPGLSAALCGLNVRLLYRMVRAAAFPPGAALPLAALFGLILYGAALFAQGFFLKKPPAG